MSDLRFNAQVDSFIRKCNKRVAAVCKQSAHDVFEDASVTTAKGGRMRVDTGFLRNSGQVSLTGLPTGPVRVDEGMPQAANLVLETARWDPLKSPIWFGWTASYARAREYYDGFMSEAVKKWQTIVTENAVEYKRRIP